MKNTTKATIELHITFDNGSRRCYELASGETYSIFGDELSFEVII